MKSSPTPWFIACCLGAILMLLTPQASAQQTDRTIGEIRLLVISADWGNSQFSRSEAAMEQLWRDDLTLAETYWTFHSYGRITSFTPTFTPRYEISETAPTMANPANPTALQNEIKALAQNDGYDFSNYDHIITSMPSFEATSNFGALGGRGFGILFPGQRPIWQGVIHELGHAFGSGHAGHLEGGNSIFTGFGSLVDGRDGLYMMGSEGGALAADGVPIRYGTGDTLSRAGINVAHSFGMGHLTNNNVSYPTKDSVIRLYDMGTGTLSPGKNVAAVVPVISGIASNNWWLSYSPKMAEHWSDFNAEGWLDGINVHVRLGDRTGNLDFTPGSQGGTGNDKDYVDSRDGALRIGNSFQFPDSMVEISPLRTGIEDGVKYIEVQIITGAPPTLENCRDIGDPAFASVYGETEDRIILQAAGNGIGGNTDQFYFCSQQSETSGGLIQASMDALSESSNAEAKAGIMIRSSSAPDARNVLLFSKPDGSISIQSRSSNGGMTETASVTVDLGTQRRWLRLFKQGSTVIASYSTDGDIWTDFHSIEIDLGPNPEFGLAVSSGDPTEPISSDDPPEFLETSFGDLLFQIAGANGYRYDFGFTESPLAEGYELFNYHTNAGSVKWISDLDNIGSAHAAFLEDNPDLYGDHIGSPTNEIFEQTLRNGTWLVDVSFGHPFGSAENGVIAEGVIRASDVTTSSAEPIITRSFEVEVTDGALTLEFFDDGGSMDYWAVTAVVIRPSDQEMLDSYDQWADRFFPISVGRDSLLMSADPNGDGVSNGLAFLTGTNPMTNDPASQPVITRTPTSTSIVLRRSDNAEGFTTLDEISTDLDTWFDINDNINANIPGVTTTVEDDGYGVDQDGVGIDKITIEINSADEPKMFVRRTINR